jgi:tetratricopeptide (TPR) repeat protein
MKVQDFIKSIKDLEAARKYDDALQTANDALGIYDSEATLWVLKADILNELGRKGEAIESYDREFGLGIDDWRIYSRYGYMMEQLGEVQNAFEHYQHALNAGKEAANSVYLVRGHLHKKQGDWMHAILDYYQFLISGNRLGTLGTGSLIFGLSADRALQEFETTFAKYPSLPERLVIRAVLNFEARNLPGAVSDLREATKLLSSDKLSKYLETLETFLERNIDPFGEYNLSRTQSGELKANPKSR